MFAKQNRIQGPFVPRPSLLALVLLLAWLPISLLAADGSRYSDGRHGRGELKHINGLPVLILQGNPEDMGEQAAVLTRGPMGKLLNFPRELLKARGLEATWPLLVGLSRTLMPQIPPDYARELESMGKRLPFDRDLGLIGNTFPDISKVAGCSSLIVDPPRSATGGPLFGRNLDYPTLGQLHQYSLVTIYRPKGKKAFASIGFPGLIGCLSGINREGLALAVHEVHTSRDNSPRLNTKGIPYTMCFRRVLEECRNVSEAEKLLRSLPRTTFLNLAVCDQQGGVIFEITPKNLVVRKGENGLTPCTNHFRTQTLSTGVKCWRYPLLVEAFIRDKLDRNDVTARLHAVNQGGATLQTMVFAPKELKLYLAIGQCPSSALPLKELALKELFEPNTQVEIPNKLNTQ